MKRTVAKGSTKLSLLMNRVGISPWIRRWIRRHPKTTRQVRSRLSPKTFTGLPLTLLSAALLYVIVLLVGVVQDVLAHDPLIAADIRIANLLYALSSDQLLRFFYAITLSAETAVIAAVAVILTVVLWFRDKKAFVATLWLTLVGSELVTSLGKFLFHRGRPDAALQAVVADSYSFPSGHAATAAAFYGLLVYFVLRRRASWAVRIPVFLSAAILVALIDLSRMVLGVHYLSDVLAGDLVGVAALLVAIGVTEWCVERKRLPAPEPFGASNLAWIAAILIAASLALTRIMPIPSSAKVPLPTHEIAVQDVLPLFQNGVLPRYTETLTGTTQEPIDLIILVPDDCLVDDVTKSSWSMADALTLRSAESLARAALLNTGYPTAPMTPSFWDAEPHDVGFEKQTGAQTARSRHHARFWKTGYATPQGAMVVGTVSLDTGIKWGIAHTIAPDIDTERDGFMSDLEAAGVVAEARLVPFVPPTLGRNFAGDPFFTDGKAAFMVLRDCTR